MKNLLSLCFAFSLASVPALAVDGQTLINQSIVNASGGFPYTISSPGSYKLSGNLVVPSGDGIHITADNVTLDLGGFTISCAACTIGAGNGIYVTGSLAKILNGGVSAFNFSGIYFNGVPGVVDQAKISGNATGVYGAGPISAKVTVTNSIFSNNLQGIFVTDVSVSACQITVSGQSGFRGIGALSGSVTGSTITGPGLGTATGIDIGVSLGTPPSSNTQTVLISNNVVTSFSTGIAVSSAASGLIISNTISKNANGIMGSPSLVGVGLNFLNNASNLFGVTSLGNNVCGSAAC